MPHRTPKLNHSAASDEHGLVEIDMLGWIIGGAIVWAIVWWVMGQAKRQKQRAASIQMFDDDARAQLTAAQRELSAGEFNALLNELAATTAVSHRMLQQGMSPMIVQAAGSSDARKRIKVALDARRAREGAALGAAKKTGIETGDDGYLKPDMLMAAKGYAAVQSTRMAKPYLEPTQLRLDATTIIDQALDSRATEQQRMSARWGVVYALGDGSDIYLAGLQAYDEAVKASPNPPSTDRYEAAALAHLTMVLAQYPEEFSRYVGFELNQA